MKAFPSLLIAICGLFLAIPTPLFAEEGCEGPRILFLDDLFCPCSGSARNPYEERIETERHNFTQSATTVGCGVFQVEGGYSYFYKDTEHEIEQSHTTPEMLFRYGVSDDIEVRLRWNYAWRFIDHADDEASAEDLRLSVKLGVTEQECWVPESALQVRMTAPTGGSAWTTERVEFGLNYIYAWDLNCCWEIYGSTGAGSNALGDFGLLPDEPADEHFLVWSQSAGIGCDLTEQSVLYAEYYGLFSQDLDDDFVIHMFNLGIDYYVTNDFVLDLRVGKGLSDDADDLFVGAGGGYRF